MDGMIALKWLHVHLLSWCTNAALYGTVTDASADIGASCPPFKGVYQPRRVGMMHECSTGELLAGAAFMHHDDKRA